MSVTGCNGTLANSTYTIGPASGDCTITAAFAIDSYSVTPVTDGNGGANPSAVQAVTYGNTASFTFTPIAGYHIASVTGCSGTLTGNLY